MIEDRSSMIGPVRHLLQFAISALAVYWAIGPRTLFNEPIFTEQYLALCLSLAIATTFLSQSEFTRKRGVSLFWLACALLSALGAIILAIRFPTLMFAMSERPAIIVAACSVTIIGSLTAVWRNSGIAIVVIALVFIIYALLGHLLTGSFQTRFIAWDSLALYLGSDPNGILGSPLAVACVIVIPFLLFGNLLSVMGAADFFTDFAAALMGRYRGGAAKISVTASALFGSISGSAVANVAATGVVTIPLMKKGGFRPEQAGAIEAVASTGGQLMPPIMGAAAFLMADFLQVPYSEVLLAAIIPAFLYYIALFFQIDLIAARHRILPMKANEIPPIGETIAAGWHFILPFVVLVYGLFWMNMQPEYAALSASALLLIVGFARGYKGRRPEIRAMLSSISAAGGSGREIITICAMAGIVIGILNLTGAGFTLSVQLVAVSGGNILLLSVLTAIISIILGMGMPTVGVYVLLATLVAPALVNAGISTMAAHMFVMYFGMLSMVTPPIALAAFAAANIAKGNPWRTSWLAARFAWSTYIIPFLFIFSPTLLLAGHPGDVVWAVTTATIGIFAATAGIVGQLFGSLQPIQRLLLFVTGICAMTPANMFDGAIYVEAGGIVTFFIVCWIEHKKRAQLRT